MCLIGNTELLCTQGRDLGLNPRQVDVSWDFSRCSINLGYILELQRVWPFETPLGSAKSGFLSS